MSDIDALKGLVQKAAAGDEAAFEELYRATCRSVYFTCYGFLKDEQEAQDVTQEVYLTAYEQLGTLEDESKFKPWLYRIAANKSMNCLKKKRPLLPGDEQFEGMETEDNENFLPEEYALNADKRELVLKIVRENCSDVLYQTIILHYFNEFSIAEIAEIMECPEGTVKYRLSAARAKIKEGVLKYEKKSSDKLYAVAAIPFLTAMFTAQMQDMQMPEFPPVFSGVIPKSKVAASAAKTGGKMLKGLQLKAAVAIAAAVVGVGGITAAAVFIANQNAEEASVGAGTPDAAWVGNTEDGATLPETEDTGIASDEETKPTEETGDTEEVAAEESTETEKPETAAEPQQQYTYADMSAVMYAQQSVNVRNLPDTEGERVGSLSVNQEIAITGQCNETGWYRFEYNGSTAYVSNKYVSENKVEVSAQSASSDNGGDSTSGSSTASSGLEQYGEFVWNDMGDWFVYINYARERPDTSGPVAILQQRYPDQSIGDGLGVPLKDGVHWAWFVYVGRPQGLMDFGKKYAPSFF